MAIELRAGMGNITREYLSAAAIALFATLLVGAVGVFTG
jgi:hypothetical protein